ncbi:Secreted effector protein pipB2 [Gimesia maris]|uniref:pentapeptide repeat-containing protein n=1 Tax=Gimesia maris TaxID=122 RepID=UPI00118C093F|nr:pentapeptide repeat-containing protein [Gimesia maris]QDU13604.1 Secreted effector protein pipB2 [Gimesia maris]
MANEDHVRIVWEGAEAIAKWRSQFPGERLDLSNAVFIKHEAEDAITPDLEDADLSYAILTDAILENVNLKSANLANANLRNANLRNAILSSSKMEKVDLSSAHLENAKLLYTELSGARLSNAKFKEADLRHSLFIRANLNFADFTDSRLDKATILGANIEGADFNGASMSEIYLSRSNLKDADLTNTNLRKSELSNTNLTNTNMTQADLSEANLIGANLSGVNLTKTVLLGVRIDSSTEISSVYGVIGCEVDRYTLEYLSSQDNNLTSGKMMDMNIHDDLATLKSQFGGFWGGIHLTSIILFLSPYIWFLVSIRPIAEFNLSTKIASAEVMRIFEYLSRTSQSEPQLIYKSMTLFEALVRYIWSGGVDWYGACKLNLMSFLAFYFFLSYNMFRGMLLWKTKKLETIETVTKLPVLFSLNHLLIDFSHNTNPATIEWGRIYFRDLLNKLKITKISWGDCLYLVNKGVWVYLLFVLYNTLHFLTMEILI